MLINAITDIKNIIYSSNNFDIFPVKSKTTEYSFTTEDMKFQVSYNTVTECYVTIDFTNNINFREFICDTSSSTVPVVKCYYSFDNYVFDEFPYITYTLTGIVSNEQDYLVLKKYTNEIIHTKKLNNGSRYYSVFNKSTGKLDVISMDDSESLKRQLDDAFVNDASPINIKYIWKYENNNETIYLNKKEIRFFKAVFSRFGASLLAPFSINSFSVIADQTINSLDLNNISMFNGNFFKQKYFEIYDFIPSVAKSFFEMLSYSDKEINKVVPDITVDFALDNIDHSFHLLTPTDLNIDKYFEPSLIVKIDIDDRFYTFVYTTLPTVYTDVNPIINRVLSDQSNYTYMDISVSVHTNKFDITKQRTYYTPFNNFSDGWVLENQIGQMTIGEDFYVN